MIEPERSPSPDVAIRRATAGDLAALRLILSETWRDTYTPLIGAAAVDEMARSLLSDEALRDALEDGLTLVAQRRSDGEALALAYARGAGDDVFVQRLYVRPGYQGRGLGRDLLNSLARMLRATRIRLDVEAGNAAALAFYRASGFCEMGQGEEEIAGVVFRVRHLEWRA